MLTRRPREGAEWLILNRFVPVTRPCASTVPATVPGKTSLKYLYCIMNHGSVPLVPLTFTKLNIEHIYYLTPAYCKPT